VSINPAPGTDDKYAYGTKITLTASPETGYGWKNWTGTGNDSVNPAIITINSEKHLEVNFEERYLVLVNNQALSSPTIFLTGGKISASPGPGTDSRFAKNSLATFTAVPAAGYRFDSWTGDIADKAPSVSLMMDKNKSIAALFIRIFNLTASATEGGTVSPTQGTYDTGTTVTLTATPDSGYHFKKWSGDAAGTSISIPIRFDADKAIIAEFIRVYLLSTSASPSEGGTVTPGGTYDTGTDVTIAATAAVGYRFDVWAGDVYGTAIEITVPMVSDKTAIATFIKTYKLTVAVSPVQGGTVNTTGGTYDTGKVVPLTATPATGYTFYHWSGGVSDNTTATANVTMNADITVTAFFKALP
jgi:trimeric autotransporter adhesin